MNYHHVAPWQEADSSVSPTADALTASWPPLNAPKGTWFDPSLDFRDPEGEIVAGKVLALIAAVEHRDRKRRQTDEINHRTIVRKILANGFRCHYHRRPSWVAYYRKAESYRDGPPWLSGTAMRRTVDLLARAGLLEASLGEWGGAASTYKVTGRLYSVVQAHGVTEHSLTLRLPSERLVRLRRGNSGTPLIDFEPTGETGHWTAQLEAYNAFLAQQDIALALSADEEAEWVRHWNKSRDRRGVSLHRPELIQTDLYRQFNNGSFEQGGRMYGGWWINTPKALRRKITINGQPTVELDYSGCAIRMLYHERGIDFRDDPYRLQAIAEYEEEAGLRPGYYREGIKAMMQALINDRSGGKPERIPLPDGLSFRPHFTRSEVRRMIEEKHASIADAFGTGAGLRLQRKDSDLALAIITGLRERGVLALPVHDSFLVSEINKRNVISLMRLVYRNMFNFNPIIK